MHEPERISGTNRPQERVTVVVLNWNGWVDTLACIESLRGLIEIPPVIVVDNGSTDDSVARLRASAPWVRILALPVNRGFGGGMNAGIAAALEADPGSDFLWLLNNDTVVEPTTLSRMMAVAGSDERIGIVGNRLVEADGSGRVQAMGGGGVNRWLGTTSTYVTPSASEEYHHLVGASVLVRRSLLTDIGGFDERYFFYLEDTDLSLRARRAGWRLAVAEDAIVVHRRGASIDGRSSTRSVRSDLSAARGSGIFVWSLGLPWRISAVPLRMTGIVLRRLARRQIDRVIPTARAYIEGLRIGRRSPDIPNFSVGSATVAAGPVRRDSHETASPSVHRR